MYADPLLDQMNPILHSIIFDTSCNVLNNMMDEPISLDVPIMIDPLPLPPNHRHKRHASNRNTLQDVACVPSPQKEGNLQSFTAAPYLVQQGALKRNRGYISADNSYPITSLSGSSRNRRITTRPPKKLKTTADAFLNPAPPRAVGETNSIRKSSTTASRLPVLFAMKCDNDYLSKYQCLLRQQIEIFEA